MNKKQIIEEIEKTFNKKLDFFQYQKGDYYFRIGDVGYIVYLSLKKAEQSAEKQLYLDIQDNFSNLPEDLKLNDKEIIKGIIRLLFKKYGKIKFVLPYGTKEIITSKGLLIKELGLDPEDMEDMYLHGKE